jgi:hypothetical protein
VLRPMPRPSVNTATIDKVGYLTSIRMPERRSVNSCCMEPGRPEAMAPLFWQIRRGIRS